MTFGLPRLFWQLLAVFLAFAGMTGATVFVAMPLLHITRTYSIPTRAMSPTIEAGDMIYTYEWAYRDAKPSRGDVVVFSAKGISGLEQGNDLAYIKRLVGFPGESISIHDDNVWVNGKAVPELAHFHYQPAGDFANVSDSPYVVPADSYFVLGDNPKRSKDGRFWGSVPAANLRGCAELCLWPPQRFGVIH